MADASVFGKPVNKYKQDIAAVQDGAGRPGTLRGMAPASNRPVHVNDLPDGADSIPQGLMGEIDDSVAAVQQQNMANPSIQEKLQKIAAEKAKFDAKRAAQMAPAALAPELAPDAAIGQVYPAMQPKGRR